MFNKHWSVKKNDHLVSDSTNCISWRQQRMAEMQKLQRASKFGDVREISAQDYVEEVNKAGKGVWVVLHLYKSGYPFQGSL